MTSAPPLSFAVYADLLMRYGGLKFAPEKAYLLSARLSGILRREECASLDELARKMAAEPARLEQDVAEAMLNNETFFFRDRVPFDEFETSVLPRLREARASTRRLRIWSAACSNGQEPYSLAMQFAEAGTKWAGWGIEIFGSDLSRKAVARAREGLYSQFEVQRGLSTQRLLLHFRQDGDMWRLKDDIRGRVRFEPRNLMDPLPRAEVYDVIFARNVLMYFSAEKKAEALRRMAGALAPDGLLILGAAETLFGQRDLFQPDGECRGYYGLTKEAISLGSRRIGDRLSVPSLRSRRAGR